MFFGHLAPVRPKYRLLRPLFGSIAGYFAQNQLPMTLIGAGLPQLVGQAGRAKSYAERLFEYPEIGALSEDEAKKALIAPAIGVKKQHHKNMSRSLTVTGSQ